MERMALDVEVEDMDTSDFTEKIAEAKVMLRAKALAFLKTKRSYKDRIRDMRVSIAAESTELSRESENLKEKVLELEEAIIKERSVFRTKELLLQFGQMSLTMNSKVGLDSSLTSSKLSDDENGAVISQLERLYQVQTRYIKLDLELKALVETRRKLQAESLDYIVQSRCKYLEMNKVKKKIKSDDEEANTREETRRKDHLKKGVRVHLIISRLFEELIMCSQLDWYKNPELRARLIKLKKGLELDNIT